MGQRRHRRRTNNPNQNSPQGEDQCNSTDAVLEDSTHVKTLSPDDIELTLYQKIQEIRADQLSSNFSDSRTLANILPSWPPCPLYRCHPKGLMNKRNICYLISCLQALFSISPFVAILHQLSEALHSLFSEVGCLREAWPESQPQTVPLLRLLLLHLDERTPYRPNESQTGELNLPDDMGYIPTGKPLTIDHDFFTVLNLEAGCEQDAADCMSRLITQIHEEMANLLRKFKQPQDDALAMDNNADDANEDDGWTIVASRGQKIKEARHAQVDNGEVTPISLLFGGNLVSRSSYQKASFATNKSAIGVKERFFVLPLELRDPNVRCLEDGFQFLSKGEVISDFKDPETGLCVVMNRRVFIDRLPPFLLIQLNRFYYSSDQGGIQKVLKQIPIYPRLQIVESIVSKERSFSRAQGAYKLKAVVFHIGYMAGRGHYTTATLTQRDEILYYDDINVFRVAEDEAMWTNMFTTHLPFDARTGRFRPMTRAQLSAPVSGPGMGVKASPSIGEQPRTPYLLVYASCFQQHPQRQSQRE